MVVRRIPLQAVPRTDATSWIASLLLTSVVVLVSLLVSPVLLHWFLLPLLLCGTMIGVDLIDWMRGRTDLFDARGSFGLLGYHFFFVAPLLMVSFNYRMHYLPEQPDDYRDSLGWMAVLNVIGLLLYRLIMQRERPAPLKRLQTRWQMNTQRFWIIWSSFVAASIAAEIWTLILFGGVSGYLAAYSSWLAGNGDSFAGVALLFAVSESLPILLVLGFAFWAHKRQPSLTMIVMVFAVFVVMNLLIGGLRGSRSNVIWTTFWAAGIVHLYVRKIPRTAALASIIVLYGFVSIYAAYKQHGANLLEAYHTSGEYTSLNQDAEDLPTVLVGDFSRADVQANLIWRMAESNQVQLAWGKSYLGALAMLIPRSMWAERPPTIITWITDAEYGRGVFASGMMRSTRVYGIAGEAALNFGLAGVPLSFLFLAWAVRSIRNFTLGLDRSDGRLLIVPFLVNLIFLLILDDSDNFVFYLVKYGLIPVLLIVLSSSRVFRRVIPCKLLPQRAASAIL